MQLNIQAIVPVIACFLQVGCMSYFGSEESSSSDSETGTELARSPEPSTAKVRSNSSQAPSRQPVQAQGMTHEEQELRMAKLWARVDELETRVIQQQEKISLLERGLMLGIVPSELQSDRQKESPPSQQEDIREDTQATKIIDLEDDDPGENAQRSSTNRRLSDADYRRLLAEAQSYFNQGNYGQAIASYQKIAKDYPAKIDQGQHHYWIGMSWYYLKEDELAEESLRTLAEEYPASPWIAQSRFYLAKIDLRRGYRQRALSQFRQIIEDFPGRDIEEMARFELDKLKETL